MKTILLGGDARMPALAGLLRRKGVDASFIADAGAARAALPSADQIVSHCPPKLDLDMETLLALAAPEATVFLCGPGHFDGDERVVDLWADEALLQENARFTAEGAVAAAMRAGRRSLRGLDCVVIGWGRIGSALTEILTALGANVTVISRSTEHRQAANRRGAEALPPERMGAALSRALLVFSTPPVMVLDEAALTRLHSDAMVIDLASPPYGVDLKAAWRMGLRAWREPGLPGRYCPVSAASALLDAMRRGRRQHD